MQFWKENEKSYKTTIYIELNQRESIWFRVRKNTLQICKDYICQMQLQK